MAADVSDGVGFGPKTGARRDVAAILPRDRRPFRSSDTTLTRPDPFEDIPAPRLRLLRLGASVALVRPRHIPSLETEPASAGLAARERTPGANGITVLRLPRAEDGDAKVPPEPPFVYAPTEASPDSALATADAATRGAAAALDEAATPAPPPVRKPRSVRPARRKPPAVAATARAASAHRTEGLGPDAAPDPAQESPKQSPTVTAAAPAMPAVISAAPAVARPSPARVAAVAPASPRAASDLRRGVVAGLIVAVGLVVLALVMRPDVSDGASSTQTSTATAVGSAPMPDPAQATASAATPTAEIVVRLRLGPGAADAYRNSLRATVETAGYASVEVRSMPYPVDRPRVQFYDPADRAAAEALARALAPLTGELIEMRDLSPIAKPDEAGSIDAWLAATPTGP